MVADGCERVRTVANVNATSSEHTLNAQTPRLKREPLLHIREKPKISSKSVKHPSQKVWHEPPADFIDGSAVLEKMVILFQQRVPSIDATMFSMQQVQQFCNKCVLSVQTFLSKDICEYSGQDLGKMHMRYMQWTCENHLCVCIGWTCNSAIPPCLSGLIWINQKPTQNKKLKPRLGNQS